MIASQETPFCTDEELLQELKKLGYNDVPAEAFLMMKKDLSELVLRDQSISNNYFKRQEKRPAFKDVKSSAQPQKFIEVPAFLPGKSPTFIVDTKTNASQTHLTIRPEISSLERHSIKGNDASKNLNLKQSEEETPTDTDTSSDVLKGNHNPEISGSFTEYKERFKSYKERQQPKTSENEESSNSSSSVCIEGNKLKRKVLRRKNGKPVITEEFIEIPSIFNTSYPETESSDAASKSLSGDEMSFKSNSSTGSVSAASPTETPRSIVSVSSTRSMLARVANQRKKKSDPVARYNYYKTFWNEFKPPGEKSHDKLRWAIRDRMLDYSL